MDTLFFFFTMVLCSAKKVINFLKNRPSWLPIVDFSTISKIIHFPCVGVFFSSYFSWCINMVLKFHERGVQASREYGNPVMGYFYGLWCGFSWQFFLNLLSKECHLYFPFREAEKVFFLVARSLPLELRGQRNFFFLFFF